jgi:hypothetical protein
LKVRRARAVVFISRCPKPQPSASIISGWCTKRAVFVDSSGYNKPSKWL